MTRLQQLARKFELHETKTTLRTEIGAGLATFLTASYIIIVNPSILSTTGMDKGALVSVTCLAAAFGTLLMGLWPKAPIMLAPGMGLNSFFAYSLCKNFGVPWQTALGVVFLSGALFFLLTLVGIRERVFHAIPRGLRVSVAVGIGLFISFIGLQQLGVIQRSDATMVTLGRPSIEMTLGAIGFFLMAAMEVRKIRGSILIGILAVTVLGAIVGNIGFPSQVVALPQSITPLFMELDVVRALSWTLLPMIFTFMYVDMFDSLGTFIAVSRRAGLVQSDGSIPKLKKLLQVDGVGTMAGALLGTSTVTAYIESAVGIAHGGRTGITAVTTAVLFLAAMFLAPLVLAVPAYATAPALILVGIHMVRDIQEVNFSEWEEAVPAFLTMILMPLTFSIANGIMFGFLAHVALKVFSGKARSISLPVWILGGLSGLNLIFVFFVGRG